jgi:hypothetical protein
MFIAKFPAELLGKIVRFVAAKMTAKLSAEGAADNSPGRKPGEPDPQKINLAREAGDTKRELWNVLKPTDPPGLKESRPTIPGLTPGAISCRPLSRARCRLSLINIDDLIRF